MAVYTEIIDTSFNYPHINIYKRFKDGNHCAYKACPQTGYVMYSQSTDVIEIEDNETGDNKIEIYYCEQVLFPKDFDFDNFDYVATLEGEPPTDCNNFEATEEDYKNALNELGGKHQ
jgi:hypothetical protein